ncbi:YvcK family protein [Clostridiaceae bacterium 35-E11]
MNLKDWLKPGLKIKRWVFLGLIGMILVGIGVHPMMGKILGEGIDVYYYPILFIIGMMLIGIAGQKGLLSILILMDTPKGETRYRNRFDEKLYKKRVLNKGPKVVTIGGGTGLSVLLRGLKNFTSNITAIVTVADDGGGSGILREDLGMLPPGDIRNCILALADTEPLMEQLLQYRFEEGSLKGQSFGNLLIAAMDGISNNFEEAIQKINRVLAVTGQVLPVTTEDVTLYAKLKNGKVVKGESQIPMKVKEFDSEIDQVFIKPDRVKPLPEAIEAIHEADIIILGPGSLYTSVIPNLLVPAIAEALKKSSAVKIYVSNVMTQPGETDGYGVWKHIEAMIHHLKYQVIDYVFVNNEEIPKAVLERYVKDGAEPIKLTQKERSLLLRNGIQVIEGSFIDIKKQYIRHDAYQLSALIMKLITEEKYAMDKKRIWDYSFVSDKIKNMEKIDSQ